MRGDGLQTGFRPSKAGDKAAARCLRAETGSGVLPQAIATRREAIARRSWVQIPSPQPKIDILRQKGVDFLYKFQ